jgi:hypothetical protein
MDWTLFAPAAFMLEIEGFGLKKRTGVGQSKVSGSRNGLEYREATGSVPQAREVDTSLKNQQGQKIVFKRSLYTR